MSATASILKKYISLIWWVLMLVCLILPIVEYDSHFFFAGFLMLVIGVAWRLIVFEKPSDDIVTVPRSPFLIALGLFWIVAFISAALSDVSFVSFTFFGFISVLPLSFLFVTLEPDKPTLFKHGLFVICAFYCALCISTVVQYFFFPNLLYYGLTHFPMANPNSLAGYLSLGFFVSYGMLISHDKILYKRLLAGLCALIFMAMFTTGSRGAFLSLVGGMTLLNVFLKEQFSVNRSYLYFIVLSGIFSFLFVSFAEFNGNSQTAADVLTQTISGDMQILQQRPQIWQSAFNIAMDHFWHGTGIGTFFLYYPEYRLADYGTSGLMVHNDPLHFFSDMGIFAPILFYFVIGYAIYKTVRVLRIDSISQLDRIKVLVPFFALGSLVVHTHITFHFYILPNLFMIGALMAFWFYHTERIKPCRSFAITKGQPYEITTLQSALVILLLCISALYVSSQASELMVAHAKTRIKKHQDLAGFTKWINLAQTTSLHRNGHAMGLEASVLSGVLQARENIPTDQKRRLFSDAKILLDDAIAYNPRLGSLYFEMSLLSEYAQKHFPDIAKTMQTPLELMKRAVELDPLHANTRVRYADLLIAEGRNQDAFDVLKGGLYWHYHKQEPISYFQKTATMALEFEDQETRDITLKKTLHFLRRQHKRIAARNKRLESQK